MNTENKIEKLKQGQRIAFISAFITLILAILKGSIGYIFKSRILIADAFHSSTDLFAILISGFGLWLASKKKSDKFPYGLFKAETLATFIIGLLVIWIGIELLKNGYHKLFYIEKTGLFPFIPITASIISIITSFVISKKVNNVGKSINSAALLINAQESFMDIFTSLVVSIGIFLSFLRIPYIEGTVIILISLLILRFGIKNTWTSILVLLDANLNPDLQYEIKEKINEIYGVKGTNEVKIRQSGPFKIVECKIQIAPTLPLYQAHQLTDKIEDFITTEYKDIESIFIHIEPAIENIEYVIIPVKEINGLDSKMYGHFGRAPYYIILKINSKSRFVEIEDFFYNEFLDEKTHIGIKVIKDIIKYKFNILFTNQIGELSFYMLKNSFVDIYKVEENNSVKEVINKYFNNELKEITSPTHPLEESQSQILEN